MSRLNRKPTWKRAGLAMLVVIVMSGCGTLTSRTKGDPGTYHGLGYDLEKISSTEEWLDISGQGTVGNVPVPWPRGLLWVLDTPFSFVADTLLLPVDALR